MELIATTDINVSFEGQVTKYGRQITKKITISYKGNEFSENSLWLQTLKSAKNSNYLTVLNFGVIASIFPTLLASETILKILQEPVASLTTERITLFFKLIDDEIDKRPINEKSKYRYSFQIKKFFSRLDLKIVGGGSIEGCYRASKPSFYAGKNRPVLDIVADKASRTAFTDLNELNASVKSQYHEKIETLHSACKSDIEQHLSIVENFIRLKGVPLPDHIENKIRSNVEIHGVVRTKFPPDPFHVSARIVEICAINDFSHYQYFKEQGRKFCRNSGSKECRFYVTTVEKKIIPRVEVWLCDLFLPRRILLACLISLQLATGANVSTLLTLTKSRIEKISANKYVIVGIKTKTNKEIKLEVNKRDNSLAHQAIELLLTHDSNISKYWKRNSSSVFCSLSTRGEEIFDIFNFDKIKDRWIDWHRIDHFAFDDLRDLIAQYDYLIQS